MDTTTVKERILRALEEMPSDATFDDVMERIFILQKVERGRQQIAAGQGIPHAEAKQRIKRWHEQSGRRRLWPTCRQ
jgi:predicted transcriptional regulator